MSTISDLGQKHAVGMDHPAKEQAASKEPIGFFGSIADLGEKHAIGIHPASDSDAHQ